ncbi:MAG: DNA mismatch repair protein MutS [Lachnospiraceae bacterium]|nr:DNA mismatch repair protein MutS [Lachnospiraceae bacterium]
MRTEAGFFILFAVVIVGVLIFSVLRNNQNVKTYLKIRLKEQWGTFSDREYVSEELEYISRYARRIRGDRFYIDDITWNDLNLEEIFEDMNQTMSSPGEDYLYAILRLPEFEDDVLEERERLIKFFSTEEEERIHTQQILHEIGKMKGISMGDYIFRLKEAEKKSIVVYIILALLSVCAIATLFLLPVAGVVFFIVITIVNIYTHHSQSAKMEPYFKSFSCVLCILNAVKKMEKYPIPQLEQYQKKIHAAAEPLLKLKKRVQVFTNAKAYDDWLTVLRSYFNNFFLLDFIVFYLSIDLVLRHQKELETLIENFGILDSAIAIASYREALPGYCIPTLIHAEKATIDIRDAFHPMLLSPVANSIRAEGGVLLTGSNASGKSTFLKCIAINAIFAQTIHACAAGAYQASFMKTMTSMTLRDDLGNHESYYIVEIKSIRRILEESSKGVPMLCMVDEVLRGTNTVERIAASSSILYSLKRPNVLPFAATHDIELTKILEDCYENYHFEEEIREKDVAFSYTLKKGPATTRNAIALLKVMGYDSHIIDASNQAARTFEETGVWRKLNIRR